MCNPVGGAEGPFLAEHFNVTKPMVVEGKLQIGQPVTVSRLWRCDNKYHMTAFEGRSIEPKRQVTGNSLLMEVNGENVPEWFDRLVHAGMPHHFTLHYGNYARRSAACPGCLASSGTNSSYGVRDRKNRTGQSHEDSERRKTRLERARL